MSDKQSPDPSTETLPGSNSPEEIIRQVNNLLEKNDIAAAYELIVQLLHLPGVTAHRYNFAGLIASMLNKREEAKEHFLKAVTLDPDNFDASYNLALAEIIDENLERAHEILQHLAEKYPDNANLYSDIGVIWSCRKNTGKAFKSFEKALTIDPNSEPALQRGMEYALDEKHFSEGKHLLNIVISNTKASSRAVEEARHWQEKLDIASDENKGCRDRHRQEWSMRTFSRRDHAHVPPSHPAHRLLVSVLG